MAYRSVVNQQHTINALSVNQAAENQIIHDSTYMPKNKELTVLISFLTYIDLGSVYSISVYASVHIEAECHSFPLSTKDL